MKFTNTTSHEIDINLVDGSRYTAPAGGTVTVPDAKSSLVNNNQATLTAVSTGLLTVTTDSGGALLLPTLFTPPLQTVNFTNDLNSQLGARTLLALANSGLSALRLTGGTRSGRAVNEKITVAANGSLTLLDTTSAPGPGVVDSVEIIASVLSGIQGAVFSAYVDGEAVPSVSFELNNLGTFLMTVPTGGDGNFYSTDHVEAGVTGVNWGQGFWAALRYRIPYSTSVRLVISAVPASTVYFTNVGYTAGISIPLRLKTKSIGYANRLTNQNNTTLGNRSLKFLDLPAGAGNSGYIAGLTYVGAYSDNFSYLEKNVVLYQGTQPRDGSVVPAWNSSGTEDIFGDPYYFGLGANGRGSKPGRFVSSFNYQGTYRNVTGHVDFIQTYGGLKYDDGCLFTTETGLAVDPGVTTSNTEIFYCTFYYVPV